MLMKETVRERGRVRILQMSVVFIDIVETKDMRVLY